MYSLILATVIALTNELGCAQVESFGAHVLSYVPRGGKEVFFRQSPMRSTNEWFHGGVPICWPWFGLEGDPGAAEHGFACRKEWSLVRLENGACESRAVFLLQEPGSYRLEYEVRLRDSLSMRLDMRNTGTRRFAVTAGFHPYFKVSNPTNVLITTPNGESIRCRPGMDGRRPFAEGVYRVEDRECSTSLVLGMSGNNSIVVWNVGPDETLEGLAKDDWERYVCIEPAVIPRARGFYLYPGETRRIGLTCAIR